MIDTREAEAKIRAIFPDSKISPPVDYRDVYLFQVFDSDPLEGWFDPFYSVDKDSGEVRDYSIITDGNPGEITKLFQEVNR